MVNTIFRGMSWDCPSIPEIFCELYLCVSFVSKKMVNTKHYWPPSRFWDNDPQDFFMFIGFQEGTNMHFSNVHFVLCQILGL